MLTKIISGAQIGVDIAALRAAKDLGIPTGGTMPKGFRTKEGLRPGYAKEFGATESYDPSYPARTLRNVIDSDATLVLFLKWSRGVNLTARYLREQKKPTYLVEFSHDYSAGTFTFSPDGSQVDRLGDARVPQPLRLLPRLLAPCPVLNIAGNSEADEEKCEEWLGFLFRAILKAKEQR